MTLTFVWVRTIVDYEELIFCSDSRLRFGCAWDACQKVFPLPRGDCGIAFAGDTQFAYPFIHTAINAVSLHRRSRNRQVDLFEVKSVLHNAINAMLAEIGDLRRGQENIDEPVIRLAFAGYSWRKRKFAIWKFHYNIGEREFQAQEIFGWSGLGHQRLLVLGEPNASHSASRRAMRTKSTLVTKEEDIEEIAKSRLIEVLKSRGNSDSPSLDMEPLEVLRDMIKENSSPHIGVPPQLIKVYQHMNAQAFGIRWPDGNGRVAVLGRLLPPGEKMHVPILDATTFEVERPLGNDA